MDDKALSGGELAPSEPPVEFHPSLPYCAIISPLCFPLALSLHDSLSTDAYKIPPAGFLQAAKPEDARDVNLLQETREREIEGKGEAAQQQHRDKGRDR